jgi:hypothetical protein
LPEANNFSPRCSYDSLKETQMNTKVLMPVLVLGLLMVACGGTFTLPEAPTPGPEIVEDISIPAPAAGEARLTISFGAGELKLAPGSANLVEGTATYNVPDLKPQITTEGAKVEIKQQDLFKLVEPRGLKSIWDFKLGRSPMDLTINAGAYDGEIELGGLALTGLTVKDGAANVSLSFSKPNTASMTVFRYETGASSVKLAGLANANFSTMIMSSGAGDYSLDFTGDLQRDATITISTGLSNLTLIVPAGTPATVTAETGISNINAGESWTQDGNRYVQSGSGPALTFIVQGGAGNLTLKN